MLDDSTPTGIVATHQRRLIVPAIVAAASDPTARRFLEFFTVNIRDSNTRAAYAQAVGQFLRYCEGRGLSLAQVEPMAVAANIEAHTG